MPSTPRPRTARELLAHCGRLPVAIAASAALVLGLSPIAFADEPVGEPPVAPAPTFVDASFAQPGEPVPVPTLQPASPPVAQPAVEPAPKLRDPLKPVTKVGDEPKVTVSEHMTVDLHVKDEDLANVLQLLSIQTQKNIIASKNVSAKVTATLYGVTFYQALDAILHVNGFRYMENGNFIYVYTKEEFDQIQASLRKRVAKVVRLNYLNSKDAKEFVSPMLSKDGGEIKSATETKDFQINDKTPGGADSYALGSTLVVIDFEENIAAIEGLLKQLDTRPAQVLVEATILQTALNENNAFGVDFSVIGDLNFVDFLNAGGPLSAANNLIRGGDGSQGQGFSPPNDRGNAVVSSPGNTGGPGTFKIGVIGGDVSVFVRLLDEVTDTVILSNPKILALNRQPSRVLVGRRVGYLNTTSTETSTTQTVEFLDTGTQLYFRPFVSSEGEIRMELKPQVSTAEIRTVTTTGNAAVTIPDEITQELVTNVNVKDGQTIVLGGLFTESTQFTRRQVPWVGDIPIIGAAFRGNEDEKRRAEIIFLVTPSIVTDQMIAASAERYDEHVENVRTGSRQGLLPFSRERMTAGMNLEAEKAARDGNTERALYLIQRSLSMSPNQPEVYRLRERITGLRERWPNMSANDEIHGGKQQANERTIPQTPTDPSALDRPYMHNRRVPLKPMGAVPPMAPAPAPAGQQSSLPPSVEPPAFIEPTPLEVTPPPAELTSGTTEFQRFDPNEPAPTDPSPTEPAPQNETAPDAAHSGQVSVISVPSADVLPQALTAGMGGQRTHPPIEPDAKPRPVESTQWITAVPLTVEQSKISTNEQAGNTPASPVFAESKTPEPVVNPENPQTVAATPPARELPSDLPPAQPLFVPAGLALVQHLPPAPVQPEAVQSAPAEPLPSTDPETVLGVNAGASLTTTGEASVVAIAQPLDLTASHSQPETGAGTSAASVQELLPALRSHIEMFSLLSEGRLPKLGTDQPEGWGELVTSELMSEPPANTYIGGENAKKIVIGTGPDTAYQTKYGWIYNTVTGQLWAAGFDAKDQPLPKVGAMVVNAEPVVGTTKQRPTNHVESGGTNIRERLKAAVEKLPPANASASVVPAPSETPR